MRLLFSREAEADLERIGDHIAQDNPARSVSFVMDYEALLFPEQPPG